MKRTLSLKREQLVALTSDEMSGVVGAALPTTPVKECTQTTLNSNVLCTGDCMTRGTTCAC